MKTLIARHIEARIARAKNPAKHRKLLWWQIFGSAGALVMILVPLLGASSDAFSLARWLLLAAMISVGQTTMVLSVWLRWYDKAGIASVNQLALIWTFVCTLAAQLVNPAVAVAYASVYACVYSWGILLFRGKQFLFFGALALSLHIAGIAVASWMINEPAFFSLTDGISIALLALTLTWIGVLSNWSQNLRSAYRKLTAQLADIDIARSREPHPQQFVPDREFLRRVSEELTLVDIGKPSFTLLAFDAAVFVNFRTQHGLQAEKNLIDACVTLVFGEEPNCQLATQLANSSLVFFLTKTTLSESALLAQRVEHTLRQTTLVIPGVEHPLFLDVFIENTTPRPGETAANLLRRVSQSKSPQDSSASYIH